MGIRQWVSRLGDGRPDGWAGPGIVGRIGQDPPPVAWFSPTVTYVGGPGMADLAEAYGGNVADMTVGQLWRTQPHLRTVVSFLARNVAQLGVHVFERAGELDRRRDRESPLALILSHPNGYMTTYELVYALVGDLALYDCAYWLLVRSADARSGFELHRLPPAWVDPVRETSTAFAATEYRVTSRGSTIVVPASEVLRFGGYSPHDPAGVSPTVESLRTVLEEQVEAARFRQQVWKRGGRVSAVIERPSGAPEWSEAARRQFREDWHAQYTGTGPRAGGTPILGDGMKLNRIDFSASDQQWAEGTRLALSQCAAAFHVQPAMLGQTDGLSYANVREFRRMLFGETLGPILRQVEARLSTFLAPMVGAADGVYAEFNVGEKLRGSFEEQASVLQSATGGPYMTRNEARALQNLPQVDGGDELIVPLNVTEGGLASPSDTANGRDGSI